MRCFEGQYKAVCLLCAVVAGLDEQASNAPAGADYHSSSNLENISCHRTNIMAIHASVSQCKGCVGVQQTPLDVQPKACFKTLTIV